MSRTTLRGKDSEKIAEIQTKKEKKKFPKNDSLFFKVKKKQITNSIIQVCRMEVIRQRCFRQVVSEHRCLRALKFWHQLLVKIVALKAPLRNVKLLSSYHQD